MLKNITFNINNWIKQSKKRKKKKKKMKGESSKNILWLGEE